MLRPGGRLLVAWHGGKAPTGMARRHGLPDHVLDQILDRLRHAFGAGERRALCHVELFQATRAPE